MRTTRSSNNRPQVTARSAAAPLAPIDQNCIQNLDGVYDEDEDGLEENADGEGKEVETEHEDDDDDEVFSREGTADTKPRLKAKIEVKSEPGTDTTAASQRKQETKSKAQDDAWVPVDFGIRVFAAGDPKAKTQKDKRPRQLGAQRVFKLTTPTSYMLFKTMLKELVQNDPSEESISGNIENWNVSVQLNSTGSIYSQRTALKNEEVYSSFVEELQASTKRSAVVTVEEKMRLDDAQPLPTQDPPQLQAVDALKYAYPAVQQFDKQILKRWLCNDKACMQRSKIAPSCYVNPRRPSTHVNLKSTHRFQWASALADSAQGVDLEIPPATPDFTGQSDTLGTAIVVEDGGSPKVRLKKSTDGEDGQMLKGKESKFRRRALQPAAKRVRLDASAGTSARKSIDVDLYSSDVEELLVVKTEKKGDESSAARTKSKRKEKSQKMASTASTSKTVSHPPMPDGPDLSLENFIDVCAVREKLANILREADYARTDELVQLEQDVEVRKLLGIESVVAHQFQAAMLRWRKLTVSNDNAPESMHQEAGPSHSPTVAE